VSSRKHKDKDRKKKEEKKDKKKCRERNGKTASGIRSAGKGEAPPAGPAARPAAPPCPGGKDCVRPREHLCRIAKRGDIEALRPLVAGAAFICGKCGRAAASARSLCRPIAL